MAGTRETRIDLLRGICLLLIFIGHAHFSFSGLLQHSRGFSDASELFVLLAGFSCALAYYRKSCANRPMEVDRDRVLRRAATIYLVHLALVSGLLSFGALALATDGPHAALRAFAIPSFAEFPRAIAGAIVLVDMRGNFDILPLYVLLLLALPVMAVLHRRSSLLLLAVSGSLWLVSGLLTLNLPNLAAVSGSWFFDPFSWQFVFVIGLVLGSRLRRGADPLPFDPRLYRLAFAFALLAVPAALSVHFGLFGEPAEQPRVLRLLISKTYLGPLRLLNVLAVLYVLWHWRLFRDWAAHGAGSLTAAGRNSLPVFALGLVLSTVFSLPGVLAWRLPVVLEIALVLIGCLLQLQAASWLDRRRRRSRRDATAVAAGRF